MADLVQLKSVLRSLVVSSPACVDARTLLRDYRSMMGEALPAARHGYRDPLQFLRERCKDCFLFSGPALNPVLTPIVPESLRHIDDFVQRQKTTSKSTRFMGKRRSVPEPRRSEPPQQRQDLVALSFNKLIKKPPLYEETMNNKMAVPKQAVKKPEEEALVNRSEAVAQVNRSEAVAQVQSSKVVAGKKNSVTRPEVTPQLRKPELVAQAKKPDVVPQNDVRESGESSWRGGEAEGQGSRGILQRLRARAARASAESLHDDDSGRHTASSGSGKRTALERLGEEVVALVAARPQGVWASQLPRLYEEQFGRELNYQRLGFASIAACACALPGVAAARAPDGDWLVRGAGAPPPRAPAAPRPRPHSRAHHASSRSVADPEDALPGIDYDADVFPADCLSFAHSIPAAGVADIEPGDMLPLVVGEVYSPSHMWVLLLGSGYDQMEACMDEMTEYYSRGAGASRVLAAGARRPGQYCSSVFEGDWHRSLIVQLVDSETVKVRHVDYGTVDAVPAASLRPLRRAWGTLPARALRARLAGLRPPAASRRWPRAAAAHFLHLVRDRRLVGNVVAVDREENILELFLIDTTTAADVNITDEMISAGHADPRPRPALGATESYLYPLFAALEAGDTPNYAEIHALLRDGIALDYVEAYRRHVPALLPAPPPPPHTRGASAPDRELASEPESEPEPESPPPRPPPPALDRVPLLWASVPEPEPAPEPAPECPEAAPESATPSPPPAPSPPSPSPSPSPAPAAPPATPPAPPLRPPASPAAPAPPPVSYTPRPPRPPAPPRPPHPPAFYAVPQPCYRPYFAQLPPLAFQQRFAGGAACLQYRALPAQCYPPAWPQPAPPPPPPQPPQPPGEVRLSASECEIFELLSRVDRNAAHRYMAEQLRRARAPAAAPAPALNPLAPEFCAAPRPPPGFEAHRPLARRF